MSPRAQLFPELHVVEDLAVEDQHGRPVGAGHGLATGVRKIEDRQALEAQGDLALEEHALVIRPTVRQRRGHPVHELPNVQSAGESANCHNAAHRYLDAALDAGGVRRGCPMKIEMGKPRSASLNRATKIEPQGVFQTAPPRVARLSGDSPRGPAAATPYRSTPHSARRSPHASAPVPLLVA